VGIEVLSQVNPMANKNTKHTVEQSPMIEVKKSKEIIGAFQNHTSNQRKDIVILAA
jgi:hypothetical protein